MSESEQQAEIGAKLAQKIAPVTRVALGSIDLDDERYRITRGRASSALRESLKSWGCLVPPICARTDGALVPVTGFKRLSVLMKLRDGEHLAEIRELNEWVQALDVLAIAARDTRRDRALTPFECCRAIRRAIQLGVGREEIAEQLLNELGLEPHEIVVKRHLKLEAIPELLARYLESQDVSLRRALKFVQVTREQADLLVSIGRELRFSLRNLEECARMLSDVARRDSLTWREVAKSAGLLEAIESEGRAPDRARPALDALWSLRYPSWHAANERAAGLAAAVDVSARVRLSWDRRFEKEGLELSITAQTLEELESDLTDLSQADRLARLAELFEAL